MIFVKTKVERSKGNLDPSRGRTGDGKHIAGRDGRVDLPGSLGDGGWRAAAVRVEGCREETGCFRQPACGADVIAGLPRPIKRRFSGDP